MIVEVFNLGPIKKAMVDMCKPFIMFCGPNSTGKTYLSYLLYAINEDTSYFNAKILERVAKNLLIQRETLLSYDIIKEYVREFSIHIKSNLGSIFGLGDSMVDRLFGQFDLNLNLTEDDYSQIVKLQNRIISVTNDIEVVLEKVINSEQIRYKISENKSDMTNGVHDNLMHLRFMLNSFFHILCFGSINGVRMLTVERNSIYTFNTELSLSRNELIDRIQQKNWGTEDVLTVVNNSSRRYPLTVRNSLKIANDLSNVQKYKSPFYQFAEKIESGILHGEIKITRNGDVEFIPNKATRSKHLPIHISSSIVKTMSSLVIYLKHIARKGDLLIIDEPEMNFHPDVQIVLTRLFSALLKAGLRVVVSTHSDYIIREVNNLIMANTVCKNDRECVEELGYSADMLLNKEDVQVKYFNYTKSKKVLDVVDINVVDDGFAVESIDNTINNQNKITEILFDRLQEDLS